MMSNISGKDTKPEMMIRRGLHALGFRYRLHDRSLPGAPDIVLPKYKAVVEVNGCFWHGHDCHLFRMPETRRDFWEGKIARNRERDAENRRTLSEAGWRQLVVWECSLKGRWRRPMGEVLACAREWILSDSCWKEILAKQGPSL